VSKVKRNINTLSSSSSKPNIRNTCVKEDCKGESNTQLGQKCQIPELLSPSGLRKTL